MGINFSSHLLFAHVTEDQMCIVSFHSVVLANIFIVQIVLVYGNEHMQPV